MGCAVACVAYVLGIDYDKAHGLFKNKAAAWTDGYYCDDLVDALARGGDPSYRYQKVHDDDCAGILPRIGTIVFCDYCPQYPCGHYMVRCAKGWMNPWVNYPRIDPACAAMAGRLPSPVIWAVYPPA